MSIYSILNSTRSQVCVQEQKTQRRGGSEAERSEEEAEGGKGREGNERGRTERGRGEGERKVGRMEKGGGVTSVVGHLGKHCSQWSSL